MSAIQQLLTDHIDIWTAADTGKKSGRGRGSSNAGSVYGIRKLRDLILELAVRGKLVPQDPRDEPASELLKRIQAEKAKLIANGKIKKDKPLPTISEEEKPFELPQGWEWVRFDVVANTRLGKMLDKAKNKGINRPYLRNTNVQWFAFEIDDLKEMRFEEHELDEYRVIAGDLVICEGGEPGRCAIWKGQIDEMFIQKALHRARPWMGVFPEFLQFCFRVDASNGYLSQFFTGATIKHFSGEKLSRYPVPLPPASEQQRIVAKVDELMALCDQLEAQHSNAVDAHEKLVSHLLGTLTHSQSVPDFNANWQRIAAHFDTLFTTEASIDVLKQTLLQLAVMGKLVPQDPKDEPASELLKRIQAEKAKLIAEGKIKKDKPLAPIADKEKPFDLPKGWEWVRLFEVTTGMDSGWSPACLENSSPSDAVWGVLKTTAVQVMQYLEHENKELPEKLVPRLEAEVKAGDILFTRAGPTNRVAISCLVQTTRPKLMISDKIIRFHPVDVGVDGRFMTLCLNAGATAAFLENAKSGMAASQVNISQEKLRLAPIPMPPVTLQHRIVAKVDELMALCDQLKTRITNASQLQQKLADVVVEHSLV